MSTVADPAAEAAAAAAVSSVVSTDGTTLAYRVLGDPAARPLVLVHGWAQSSACWGPELLAELAGRFRLVVVDLRGHGHSDVAESGYDSAEQWADDLAAVLDAAGVRAGAAGAAGGDGGAGDDGADDGDDDDEGAILLGWSYGGIVVSDYLAHRGEGGIAGVVLCGAVTAISRSAGGKVGPAMTAAAEGAFDEDPRTAITALASFGTAMMRAGDGPSQQRMFGLSLATPPAVRLKMLSRRVDNDQTLRGLTIPALVVHGAHDGVVPPSAGQANAEMIPGARYVEFAESAHAPFVEEMPRFLAELDSFVDGL